MACTYTDISPEVAHGPVIGDVLDPETGEVAFFFEVCADCMADNAYSDWYKAENGFRPRWMSREERIEAYWTEVPGVGVRP